MCLLLNNYNDGIIKRICTMLKKLKEFGPGILITAAFIGPGTITSCTLSGAGFGYALLWGLSFSILATIVLQEMAARLGLITRMGLGEALREQFQSKGMRMLAVVLVLERGTYKVLERFMIALVTLMSLTFLTTAIIIHPDWATILKSAVVPFIPNGSFVMLMGLTGTTVVPYNLFLHASVVRERSFCCRSSLFSWLYS